MMRTRNALFFTSGFVAGALLSWALGIAYLSLLHLEPGSLAVPLALAAALAILLIRIERFRWIGFGVLAGAAVDTAFFFYLFSTWSRGLEGF